MIFDSHAHYLDEAYDADRDEVLSSLFANGVSGIINCSTTLSDSEACIRLAGRYPGLWAAVGVYPHDTIHEQAFDAERLRELALQPKVVAIGEIGLDYYYDDAPKALQMEWLRGQIGVANELGLSILFHDREAHADTLQILRELRPKGVIHCFSGSVEMEREVVKLGLHIGLGGAVTFKNARVAPMVAADVPLERLLLETDAPYMSPVPFRGKRNRSDYIRYVAEKIADIRGVGPEVILNATEQNARRLFGISE